jgi:dCTP deaminase
MILSETSIFQKVIITPFVWGPIRDINGNSWGSSVAGYDIRCEHGNKGICQQVEIVKGDDVCLVSSIEHFDMPNNVLGMVCDKSSLARQGLFVQNTVIEPGWRGYLTLELTYQGPDSIIIHDGQAIAQVIFMEVDEHTQGYNGKYQDQPRGPQEVK